MQSIRFNLIIKFFVLFYFICFQTINIFSQDQRIADSLTQIYLENERSGLEKLELLRNLSFNEVNDLKLSLKYAEELIKLSIQQENYIYLYRGYLQKGNTNRLLGDLNIAFESFFKAGESAIKAEFIDGEGTAYMGIADVYSEMGNSINAETYYNKSIEILRKSNDSITLATALINVGDEYFHNKKYSEALNYFEESGLIFKKTNYLIGIAYNLGNIGMVYAEQGKNILAKKNIGEAIKILEDLEDYYAISDYLISMSNIYLSQNDLKAAINYAEKSLALASKYRLKKQLSVSNLRLSELYEKTGNQVRSFKYYKDHITFRDSITNIANVEQMADLRTNFEVSQKQTEVDLLEKESEIQLLKDKRQRTIIYTSIIALVLIFLLALGLYRRYHFIKKTNRIIEAEKNRSETLLLNILPEETAKELKEKGKVQAKKFKSVTVLFTDFKGFTKYAENLAPEKLVESIDFYFSKFDEIMEKFGLEKIKTSGDSYMCAGGLPFPTQDHAFKVMSAAIEIIDFVKQSKNNKDGDQTRFDIRIGINSGPVVAGIVGTKKFSYDIWGDTVNVASRMETNSEPGKINISQNTYEIINGTYNCAYRGEIKVRNHGVMKMYFADI